MTEKDPEWFLTEHVHKTIHCAISAIQTRDYGLPCHLWPTCTYHERPVDAWDRWENTEYKRQQSQTSPFWTSVVGQVRHAIGLYRKRLQNPLYCNKSIRNAQKAGMRSPKRLYRRQYRIPIWYLWEQLGYE